MQKALDNLKALISKPPILASPEPGETLLPYVMETPQVVSTPVVEREELRHMYKVQRPIYYISKVLSDYEIRYNQVQKQLYAISIMKHKLLHYFESHPIHVATSFGLGEIVADRLSVGRIAKWPLELMGLNITYVSYGNQVPSPSGFCSRMDQDSAAAPPSHSRALEHVLQWLFHPQWRRGRHSANLS
jgi:hypothetical protein